jgi:hypothetical protein
MAGLGASTVVDILKVGISGFCILLVWFAYLLLKEECAKNPPRDTILAAIKWFMGFSLVFALVVALSPRMIKPTEATGPSSDYQVDYSLFHVDLRGFTPVADSEIRTPKSLVTVHRADSIRKTTAADRNYAFIYYTTGKEIQLHPVKGSIKPQLNLIDDKDKRETSYEYVLPIGSKALNYSEVIMNDFTFVNGFRDDQSEWWVAPVQYPTKEVAVFFEFPAGKSCKSVSVYRQRGRSQKQLITDNPALISQDGHHVYWIGQNEAAETYIWFQWDW